MNLNNYSFEFTPTDTSAVGTLLYIVNYLSYKCQNDLNSKYLLKEWTGIYFYWNCQALSGEACYHKHMHPHMKESI